MSLYKYVTSIRHASWAGSSSQQMEEFAYARTHTIPARFPFLDVAAFFRSYNCSISSRRIRFYGTIRVRRNVKIMYDNNGWKNEKD